MKKHFLIACIACCLSSLSIAQLQIWQGDFAFNKDTNEAKHFFLFHSEYEVNSNSLTNDVSNRILSGRLIDREIAEDFISSLDDNNRIGSYLDASIWYKRKLNGKDLSLVFNLHGRSFRAIEFTNDVMEVLLLGNRALEGEVAELAPTRSVTNVYQGMYVGAEKKFENINLLVGGGLTLQKLSYYRNVEIERGTLFTEELGRSIDLDIRYVDQQTRSLSANNLRRIEGWGGTITAYAEKQFENQSRLAIEVKDIGFVNIGEYRQYSFDTTFTYDGVDYNDLVDNSGSDNNFVNLEDVLTSNEEFKGETITTTGSIQLNYFHQLNQKVFGHVGVKQFLTSTYKPRVYVRPYYEVSKTIALGLPLAYGGFGKFDAGLSLRGNFFKNYYYTIDVNYLEFITNPKNSSGQGVNFLVYALF